ncbi:Nuclear transport factor family protein [Salix suchowensis]|nr:Nuclear transport factor family protein [Salix suchowensis]
MAATVNFYGQPPQQAICPKGVSGLTFGFSPFKGSSQSMQNKMKMACLRKPASNKSFSKRWVNLAVYDQAFYTCINEKNLKELDGYISDDCIFEDCSFLQPMQGKKYLLILRLHFFEQLTAGMGQNVKIILEHMYLFRSSLNKFMRILCAEWKTIQIPFTKGSSFYECYQKEDRLAIKKALVVTESPIKPGGIVLTLLRNVTAIFDDFPKAAEWLLTSPHVITRFCLKIYSRLLAPFVNPLLAGYIRAWNLIARLFAFALNTILHFLKKNFG